jgi:hypothetical protein
MISKSKEDGNENKKFFSRGFGRLTTLSKVEGQSPSLR